MNIVSTKTNAAAILTRAHLDTTTQPVAVFSLSSLKGGEGWEEEANFIGCPSPRPSAHSYLARRGSKFLVALTRCAIPTGQSNRRPSRAPTLYECAIISRHAGGHIQTHPSPHPSPLRRERVPVGRVRGTWHVPEFLHSKTFRMRPGPRPPRPSFRSAPPLYQLPPGRGERPDGVNRKETP